MYYEMLSANSQTLYYCERWSSRVKLMAVEYSISIILVRVLYSENTRKILRKCFRGTRNSIRTKFPDSQIPWIVCLLTHALNGMVSDWVWCQSINYVRSSSSRVSRLSKSCANFQAPKRFVRSPRKGWKHSAHNSSIGVTWSSIIMPYSSIQCMARHLQTHMWEAIDNQTTRGNTQERWRGN